MSITDPYDCTELVNQALNPGIELTPPPAVPPGFELVDDEEYEHPERSDATACAEPEVPWTFYGVPITTVGEEGDLLALGHHDTRRFIAAANALGRQLGIGGDAALALQDTPYDERPASVETCLSRGWALFLAPPGEPGDWWCWSVSQDREGAVPVTWWSA